MSEALNDIILMVEDNPRDFKQTIRSFKKCGCVNDIKWCEDGDDALDYLYNKGQYQDNNKNPRPGLILLDINMPGTDGMEVLRVVKGDDNLKDIPVVMLSTSTDDRDINSCLEAGANSYMVKPSRIPSFL